MSTEFLSVLFICDALIQKSIKWAIYFLCQEINIRINNDIILVDYLSTICYIRTSNQTHLSIFVQTVSAVDLDPNENMPGVTSAPNLVKTNSDAHVANPV